jgi:hypothetical protein
MLRRQTAREFPDAQRGDSFAGLREWGRGIAARVRGLGAGAADDGHLDQLERLGRMRDSGLLSPSEFEEQKARLLA